MPVRLATVALVVMMAWGACTASGSLRFEQDPATTSGLEVVRVKGTLSDAKSLQIAVLIDTAVVRPVGEFILTNAFSSYSGSQAKWNLYGDTVFVDLAAGVGVSISDGTILTLSFQRMDAQEHVTPLTWVAYPHTNVDEKGLSLANGTLTTRGVMPWSWVVEVDVGCGLAECSSAQLSFTIDTNMVRPADPFISEYAFDNAPGGAADWNLHGDTVFVALAGGARASLVGQPLVRLAFVVRLRDVTSVPVALLPFPETHADDTPITPYLNLVDATPTAVSVVPSGSALLMNAPNPFNPSTTIHYRVPVAGHVRLAVLNMLGQQVRVLRNGVVPAGIQSAVWNGCDDVGNPVSSGAYLYRLQTGEDVFINRMLLVR